MEHTIRAEDNNKVNLSEHDGGLWLSIWKVGAHCSAHFNQEQLRELHQAIGEYIKETQDEL